MDIGKKLKEKRLEANYTQQELAEILHVSRQTISSWEVGRTYPDLDILILISELYDTPLDELLKEDSNLVTDITKRVKKSERRKIMNIILSFLLILFIVISLFLANERRSNNQINEYGLKPNDLIDSTWELVFTPVTDLGVSRLSFSSSSLLIWNDYWMHSLPPVVDPSELEEPPKKLPEMGLEDGLVAYDDLKIEIVDDTYIVTAHGYHQKFEKLHDTMIRDSNGTEYSLIQSSSSHDAFKRIYNQMNQ